MSPDKTKKNTWYRCTLLTLCFIKILKCCVFKCTKYTFHFKHQIVQASRIFLPSIPVTRTKYISAFGFLYRKNRSRRRKRRRRKDDIAKGDKFKLKKFYYFPFLFLKSLFMFNTSFKASFYNYEL